MKKILLTTALLFLTLITNAQELDGTWKFEKMKMFGYEVKFDGTDKDKENAINGYLKAVKNGPATAEEKANSIKGINENKAVIYASFVKQYGYNLQFKDEKIFYKFLNNDDKMEKTEGEYSIDEDFLEVNGENPLYDISGFSFEVDAKKLILTEINYLSESDDDVMVFYFTKK